MFLKRSNSSDKNALCQYVTMFLQWFFFVVRCTCQTTKHAWKERHTALSVYDKRAVVGGHFYLSIPKKPLEGNRRFRRQRYWNAVSSWLASLISEAHGCVLTNTSERGASDPDDSQGSSVEDAAGVGVLSVFRKEMHTLGFEVLVPTDKNIFQNPLTVLTNQK